MTLASIAAELLDAHDHARQLPPLSTRGAALSPDDAYAVAAEHLRLRRARGEQPVGRKIGFTNRNIWSEYGVDGPIWAHMYASTVRHAHANAIDFALAGTVAPRIEPEIAFKLNRPITDPSLEPAQMLEAVEWMARSFEIVDCPYPNWKFNGADAIAAFSFHAALIVGEPRTLGGRDRERLALQLRDCAITLSRNGEVVDRGVGANALGHPCTALSFLVAVLGRQPQFAPLARGEIVTTGTLTAALPIAPGETWATEAAGIDLPALSVRFT